ncbi:hypothetical protein CRM22_001556 [Opisthorchis felineus]|uniref:Uncharacterized protein n=1 Tax=Opisthorchis felineus TaxID=147828 RepID=A0A4S2MEG3_OPIFE|nr:hypothetical protein CRM22_001556 [Opisthorchis felineus]
MKPEPSTIPTHHTTNTNGDLDTHLIVLREKWSTPSGSKNSPKLPIILRVVVEMFIEKTTLRFCFSHGIEKTTYAKGTQDAFSGRLNPAVNIHNRQRRQWR